MKQIAIIKLGALGDVLRTTALLRPLLLTYPRSRITWITSKEALPLLQGNPSIHEALPYAPSLSRRLRSTRFDLLLSMDDDPTSGELATSLRAGRLVGSYRDRSERMVYTPSSAKWFRMGLLNRDPDGGLQHANALKRRNRKTYVQIWAEILGLERSGDSQRYEPLLVLSEHEVKEAEYFARFHELGPNDGVVGFNPGAGSRWPSKRMSPEYAATIARRIRDRISTPVLLLGGPEERATHRRILQLADGAAIDAGTSHSLRSFAALVKLCGVVVTSDSLTLHIGTALKKPIIAFFGPTAPQEIDLYGRGVKLLPPEPCRCFYERTCRLARSCVNRLEINQLLQALEQILGTHQVAHGNGWINDDRQTAAGVDSRIDQAASRSAALLETHS